MYSVLLTIFVFCVFVIFHSYVLYPLFLSLFTSEKNTNNDVFNVTDNLPDVAVLMAAYNEEKVIEKKIESVFKTNYPVDKISVYVGSDASTDATDSIVNKLVLKYPQLKLIQFPGRTGKSGIINKLAAEVNADIFILTDANVIFYEHTIFNLVRHFKNKYVAQVCANIKKISNSNDGIAIQEKAYIAFENKLKLYESIRWRIVMGAEGGCYAIRKLNFSPVPPKFYMDDFYITLNVIEQKRDIVFDAESVCVEDVSVLSEEEFKRKVRISIGNFQNLFRYKKLLFSLKKGVAFSFWSHKVFRWFTPFLLIISFLVSFILLFYCKLFIIVFFVQLIGFLLPLMNRVFNIKNNLFKYIGHFYLMNMALLKGFFVFIKGVDTNVWQPTKREVN